MKNKVELLKKLHKIQVSVSGLKKDAKSNGYEYVSGDKVLSHVKPLMDELGLLLKQEIISIDNERQDYTVGHNSQSGPRPKVEILSRVMQRFTWIDIETGETEEALWGANGQNDFDKGVGSALTYGERYFLLKFFHVATDADDIDNPHRKLENQANKAQENASELPVFSKSLDNYESTKSWLKTVDFKAGLLQLKKKYYVSPEVEADLKS